MRGYPAFDYETIRDVVLHVRYTARDGGATFRDAVLADVRSTGRPLVSTVEAPLALHVSLRRDYPDLWAGLMEATTSFNAPLPLGQEKFPYYLSRETLKWLGVDVFAIVKDTESYPSSGSGLMIALKSPGGTFGTAQSIDRDPTYNDQPHRAFSPLAPALPEPGNLELRVDNIAGLDGSTLVSGSTPRLDEGYLLDIIVVVRFTVGN